MYTLKKGQETFQIVDGPGAGQTFVRGRKYSWIPRGQELKFEPVIPPVAPPSPPPAKPMAAEKKQPEKQPEKRGK